MNNHFLQNLNELEMDLLTELFNVGVGAAAGSLSEIVHQEVGVTIPLIELKTGEAVLRGIGIDKEIVVVSQKMSGPFEMNSMLMFPANNSLEIVKLMLGAQLSDELATELQHEALSEIGNIFLNACIGVIANMLDTTFDVSLPMFELNQAKSVFDCNQLSKLVLAIHLKLHLEESQVEGYLMFALNEISLGHLHDCLENVLFSLKQGKD